MRKFSKMTESYGYIGSVVATYWFISITLVFVNKSLLSGWESLDAPMFVTWYQCLVSVLACYAIRTVSRMFPGRFSFPSLQLDPHIIKQVMNCLGISIRQAIRVQRCWGKNKLISQSRLTKLRG